MSSIEGHLLSVCYEPRVRMPQIRLHPSLLTGQGSEPGAEEAQDLTRGTDHQGREAWTCGSNYKVVQEELQTHYRKNH